MNNDFSYLQQIASMQKDFWRKHQDGEMWIIVKVDGNYEVHNHAPDGIAPPSSYPTKRLAAARILQLLGLGPVAPQDHPEDVCVSQVVSDPRAPVRAKTNLSQEEYDDLVRDAMKWRSGAIKTDY